jgi:hypothetical protein
MWHPSALPSNRKGSVFRCEWPFGTLLQETLQSSFLAPIPLLDHKEVIALIDGLHAKDERSCISNDHVLLILPGAGVLQDRLRLSA